MEVSITNVPQSICNKLRESALNILKGQGNIAYGPIGSNIIFIGNKKKSSNLFKVLYNVTNSKVECQTDPCFRYKSFKFSSHTVAVAVYLNIFETYISKVKRSSTKDFVDNVVDISRNPNAGQRTTNPLKKGKEKQTKNPKNLWDMLIRATFMVVQFNSLNSPIHHRIATLLPSSNSFTGMSPHVIAAVENFTIKVTLT